MASRFSQSGIAIVVFRRVAYNITEHNEFEAKYQEISGIKKYQDFFDKFCIIHQIRRCEVNVMNKILIEYPESFSAITNMTVESFAEEARWAMAVKLYEMGRLTSGQAAVLAGCSRVSFLLNCRRFGASSVGWDAEELAREKRGVEL